MFNFRSTSELENFQNLILKYASKRNSYKPPAYRARNEYIYGIKRLVRSQPSPILSSYSNETMPNAEQFMLTLSELCFKKEFVQASSVPGEE
jgi:hypothetical protein